MNIFEIDSRLDAMAKTTAENSFLAMIQNPHTRYYLYYRASTPDEWGEIVVASEKPAEDYQLVTGERISSNKTVQQIKWWMKEYMRRLPLLPTDR